MMQEVHDLMDIEMQQQPPPPSSPPQADNHGGGGGGGAKHTALLIMKSLQRFREGISPQSLPVSRVSSSKSTDSGSECHEQNPEDAEAKAVNQLWHNKSKINSKIVQQKNLQTLEKCGGVTGVADQIGTDVNLGISEQEALRRQSQNRVPTPTFFHLLCEEFKNKNALLFLVVVVLVTVFGIKEEGVQNGWNDGVILLVAFVLNGFVASSHKYWKEQRARKKGRKQEGGTKDVHVIRGGVTKDICESELVYGDIVLLTKGCQVPADGLFVSGQELELDYYESADSYTINEHKPFLSFGEKVKTGDARMLVTSTNPIMSEKAKAKTRSELEIHVDKLNTCMHYSGMIVGILIILVLFLRYMVGKTDDENADGPESVGKPTGITSFPNTIIKLITKSKYMTKALIKLLGVLLVGLTEGVPFAISLAIVYWNDKAQATERGILKMASVTKICIDPFIGEDEMEVKKEVAIAIAEVKASKECGIEIIVVSSKKLAVARAVAQQCGLTTPESSVLTGDDFRKATDKQRLEIANEIHVLGEASPSDKLLFVKTLRASGAVVAFHEQTTEKAAECSDIILLDESFPRIISMVDCGKCVYRNTQSFLQLVLTTTISSTLMSFIQTAAWGDASLAAIQSIWVHLAVLFSGGFALLTKPSSAESSGPVACGRSLITAHMTRNILLQVSYQVSCLVIIQMKGSGIVGSSQNMKTLLFNIFTVCQFFNLFNARELQKKNIFRGIHRHKGFWVAITVVIVLHATFVLVQDNLGYGTRLNWKLWAACVLVGALSLLIDWIGKYISKKMVIKL